MVIYILQYDYHIAQADISIPSHSYHFFLVVGLSHRFYRLSSPKVTGETLGQEGTQTYPCSVYIEPSQPDALKKDGARVVQTAHRCSELSHLGGQVKEYIFSPTGNTRRHILGVPDSTEPKPRRHVTHKHPDSSTCNGACRTLAFCTKTNKRKDQDTLR